MTNFKKGEKVYLKSNPWSRNPDLWHRGHVKTVLSTPGFYIVVTKEHGEQRVSADYLRKVSWWSGKR